MSPKFQVGDRVRARADNPPYNAGQELVIKSPFCGKYVPSFGGRLVVLAEGPQGDRHYFEDALDPIILTPFEAEVQSYIRQELHNV